MTETAINAVLRLSSNSSLVDAQISLDLTVRKLAYYANETKLSIDQAVQSLISNPSKINQGRILH